MNGRDVKQDNDKQGTKAASAGVVKSGQEEPVVAKPAAEKPVAASQACPVCGKPETTAHAPFCSARCADVDLNRWLTGAYAIPGRPTDDDELE